MQNSKESLQLQKEECAMSKQGMQNKDQSGKQIAKQQGKNDIEFGSEYQVGNNQHQSQKKSGRQVNKK